MRIIKFRGKNKHRGWVYGNLIKTWNNRFWIIDGSKSRGGWLSIYGRYEVDPTTVGQFTGLYDKNGKEIYEGDLTNLGVVIYDIKNGLFNIKDFYNSSYDYPSLAFSEGMNNIEVIGNIHDKEI